MIAIVGGGPSLKTFRWDCLKTYRTIAVNYAFTKLPDCEIIYWSDLRFWDWYKDDILRHPARKITCARIEHPNVERFRFSSKNEPLSFKNGVLRGGNSSGYAAINLAVQMGVKKIYLLGFDLQRNIDAVSNWHNAYPATTDDPAYKEMLRPFTKLSQALHDLNVEVVNVVNPSVDSALTCFAKMSFDEFCCGV